MLAEKRIDDAARLMLAAAPDTMALQDTDQWWRERRSLARKLLDEGQVPDRLRGDSAGRGAPGQ